MTAEYDVTPFANGINAVTGYADSSTAITSYTQMSMAIRMNTNGYFDVHDSAAYASTASVAYTANNTYHVRMVTNLSTHTYSVWVTPPGGSETQIANDYAFRSDAPAIDDLGKICLKSGTDNQFKIQNHKITTP